MSGKQGAMVVFISGLPGTITRDALRSYLDSVTESSLTARLLRLSRIGTCDIVRITDQNTGQVEYHGMVEVYPAKAAMQAIEKLDNALLGGRKIKAHRYRQRSRSADGHTDERRRTALTFELVNGKRNNLFPTILRLLQLQRNIEPNYG